MLYSLFPDYYDDSAGLVRINHDASDFFGFCPAYLGNNAKAAQSQTFLKIIFFG